MTYTYDQGGNRLRKIDALDEIEVTYHYDLEDPLGYGSANNRLMYYETDSTAGQMTTPVSTTWYYYNESGNVTRVVTEMVASPGVFTAHRLEYAKNGQAVTYVIGESWEWTGVGSCEVRGSYTVTYAREFRYDSARQRYLNRELAPAGLLQSPPQFNIVNEVWTDYDGDGIYGDFAVTPGFPTTITNLRSLEPGVAKVDPWAGSSGGNTANYHANLIGTTRLMSDALGLPVGAVTYTAFGERITSLNHRYGYAGAWGYQADDDFPFLHVGARYYDPATGRFLQRDPIGIRGGLNVYAYVFNRPTVGVDPTGKGIWSIIGGTVGGIVGGALIVVTSPVWVTVVGIVTFVVSAIVVVHEIIEIFRTADRIVDPARDPVRRRHRGVDEAIGCYPTAGG